MTPKALVSLALCVGFAVSACRPATAVEKQCSLPIAPQASAFDARSAGMLKGPIQLVRAVPEKTTKSFEDCKRQDLRVLAGKEQGFSDVPLVMASTFTPAFIADARGLLLAGDASGTKPLMVDNFALIEVFDSTGARKAAFFVGGTSGSGVALGGRALERRGADAFDVAPLLLGEPESLEPNRPVRIRVTALDYGHVGQTSDIYLVPPAEPLQASPNGIAMQSATYGANCGAAFGNVTRFVAWNCNGKSQCAYRVDWKTIGDPAPGCAKDFRAQWKCGSDPEIHSSALPQEAGLGSTLSVDCNQGT